MSAALQDTKRDMRSCRLWLLAALSYVVATVCTVGPALAVDRNQENFMLNCQGCHMADGSGIPGAVPDMRGIVGKMAATDEGRRYLVRVPGVAFSQIDDASLAELMTWVIHRFDSADVPKGFHAFTASEIAFGRAHALRMPAKVRKRILAQVKADNTGGTKKRVDR